MSKRILSLVLALVMVLGTFGTAFAAATTPTGNEKVDKLIELGLVKGDANGYRLADNITRAEVATMVVRALDLEAVANASAAFPSQFKDMNSANVLWARGHVNVAAGQGIVNGYPEDGTFKPANNVTYAEAAAMLVRVLNGMTAAEQANAVWPTTYLAKAAQLGIFADVDGVVDYNAPANRENLFEMVFNTLTVGTDLLIANTVEGLVVENYRTEALAKDEVVVHVMKDQNAKNDPYHFEEGEEFKVVVTPELAEKGVDVETLLGKVVKVSYDKSGKVVGVEINNSYDYLEGKLTDITTRDLELNDKEYTVVKSESRVSDDDRLYQVYRNNEDIAYDKLKAEYANITVRNGKVLFIDAYQFDDVAPVAKDIDAKDRVAYYDDSQDGEVRTLTVDEDAYVINFVDGEMQLGDYKDISANDVIHWYESAKEVLTVIVRPSEDNKVEGEFEKASATRAREDASIKITIDGTDYPADVKEAKRDPVYSTLMSGQDFYTLSENYKAELAPFEDEEVVVLRDMFGKVQLIASETADGTFYALVLQVLNNEFKLLRADNTSEYYTTNIRNTEFVVENASGNTEEAKKTDFEVGALVKVTANDDLITKMTLLGDETDALKVEAISKNLIKHVGKLADYNDNSTVVFVDKGSKNSEAMSVADFIKNYKNPSETVASGNQGDVYAFYSLSELDRRTDSKTVKAILVTDATSKSGSYNKEIVKVDRVYFAGTDKVELRVKSSGLDGELNTYKVTDEAARKLVNDNKVVQNSIIEISLTKTDTPEIKVIDEKINEKEVTTHKVTSKSGNVVVLDDVRYRLAIDADVFGEILKDKHVAIIADANNIISIADVRDEFGGTTTTPTAGVVTYKDATQASDDSFKIEVEGKIYTVTNSTVLRNEVGVIEKATADDIYAALLTNTTLVFDIEPNSANVISSFKYRAATADRNAAKTVIDMIDALGSNPTKAAVEAARKAYDGTGAGAGSQVTTTLVQRNLVTNLAKLVAAETKIANAEAAEALQAKVNAVKTKADAGTLLKADLDAVTGLTHKDANLAAYIVAFKAKTAAELNTVAKLQAVVNTVDAEETAKADAATALLAVQNADTDAKMVDALADEDLGLDLTKYNALGSGALKEGVRATLISERATFTTLAILQARIDALS